MTSGGSKLFKNTVVRKPLPRAERAPRPRCSTPTRRAPFHASLFLLNRDLQGEWLDDERHGLGYCYDSASKLAHESKFERGNMVEFPAGLRVEKIFVPLPPKDEPDAGDEAREAGGDGQHEAEPEPEPEPIPQPLEVLFCTPSCARQQDTWAWR